MAHVEPADDDIAGADIAAGPGSHAGADETSRLLQALTALYVQRSDHTAEEQQQYTELALRLIDKAPPATRAAIAARLHGHPDAPAAVITRLAGVEDGCDGGLASGQPSSVPALAPAPTEPADREQDAMGSFSTPSPPASARQQAQQLTGAFGEAFFAAPSSERRRMLAEAARAVAAVADGVRENGRRFHVRIDSAPWRSRTGAVAHDFARLIDAPVSLCERILNDPGGEPLVVAARATGMPVDILQRILLLATPAAHHSVQRVYELTELWHALDGRTARALLAVWRDGARCGNAISATAPVTSLRARLRALNARIESEAAP